MLRKIEKTAITFSILAITVIMNVNVIMRYAFNRSWTPTEEVCLIFVVIITFVGSAYATRVGMHLFSSLVFDLPFVPDGVKKGLAIAISGICSVLCLVLAVVAVGFVRQNYVSGRTTPSFGIPFYIFYMALPLSFTLMAYHYARNIFANIRRNGYVISPEQDEMEEGGDSRC
jgi:TRAP-type C4-dicarboxylate transport system permease small subunit